MEAASLAYISRGHLRGRALCLARQRLADRTLCLSGCRCCAARDSALVARIRAQRPAKDQSNPHDAGQGSMKDEGHLSKAADVPQIPTQKTLPRPPPPNSASLSLVSASISAGTAPSISGNPPMSRVFCQGIDSRADGHRVSIVGPRRESTKYGLPMSLTLAILFRRSGVLRSDHAPTHGKQRKIRNRHKKYKNQ